MAEFLPQSGRSPHLCRASLKPEAGRARCGLRAFFRDGVSGRLFCVLHSPPPDVPVRGSFVYLHPFAEEMNKSRRMAALGARSLARAGYHVLSQDAFGCGDSEGEFRDATWRTWVEDAVGAVNWLAAETGQTTGIWGLRAGCLIASAALPLLESTAQLLYWQPVVSGKQHLQQFLRLRMAGAMLDAQGSGADLAKETRSVLDAGGTVEIAGYALTGELATALQAAQCDPAVSVASLGWFEVSGAESPALSPASQRSVDAWRAAGWQVDAFAVSGPSFWQTQEIEDAPGLVAGTIELLGAAA
ncbi:MAG: hydrolase 2, exosortase A system-associated [Burkholderiales bacterium]